MASIKPKKSLGQHFLTDQNMISKIIKSVNNKRGEALLEIGPGTGALTDALFEENPEMLALEVDDRAIEFLSAKYPGLNIQKKDILKAEWAELARLTKLGEEKLKVVGNLPYYITSPILFKLLDWRHSLSEAIVMMQKEVAERLIAVPRTKAYGILSVQFQVMTEVEYLFTVPPTVFSPPPKVESAVVKLRFKQEDPSCGYEALKKTVRTAFGQRRKKLSNTLKPLIDKDFPIETRIDLNKRAEELSPTDFVELTHCLNDRDRV